MARDRRHPHIALIGRLWSVRGLRVLAMFKSALQRFRLVIVQQEGLADT